MNLHQISGLGQEIGPERRREGADDKQRSVVYAGRCQALSEQRVLTGARA